MRSLLLLPLLLFSSLPIQAYGTSGARCYKEVWREEYVPGNYSRRGYVRRWQETVEVPCRRRRQPHYQEPTPHRENQDNNSCVEGTVIGGLLGGGIGGAVSRGNGRWIGVPAGLVLGGLIGCQIDGG